ncbi:hypothetical protein ACO0LO_02685 [Undibacterium sp. TJN25]|uniref:hypothetical protein n=1 Tax=Undibacterium sp. TJN25 TaxID=3413056 RepID=UPI003BF23D0C
MDDLSPCIEATALQDQTAELIDAGRYDDALRSIAVGVGSFYTRPDVIGYSLYLFGYDKLVLRLGEAMRDTSVSPEPVARGGYLVILSEFYNAGGHSRVAEDLVSVLGGAVVVLTDLFGSYQSGRLKVADAAARMPKAMVHRLETPSFAGKVKELQAVFNAVRPECVLILSHHPDPLPYVAAASLPETVRKVFFHHCDHQPSVGCTLPGYAHVDFTEHLQGICQSNLGRPTVHVPLYVADRGVKTFTRPTLETLTVVSSGSANKYKRDSALAYQHVVAEILSVTGGSYWHIGHLDDAWLGLISQALLARGIAVSRFCYLPHVPSLWDSMKEIDGHVFLGSFPIPGGRGSIEAQGCGYPAIYYANDDRAPLLRHADIFANKELGWSNIPELVAALRKVVDDHEAQVRLARDYYEKQYGYPVFLQRLHLALSGS